MRLVTFCAGGVRPGLLSGGAVYDLETLSARRTRQACWGFFQAAATVRGWQEAPD